MNPEEPASRPASVALAPLGVGIGWREELAGFIARRHGLGFVEVVAEGVHPDRPLPGGLEELSPGQANGVIMRRRHSESSGDRRSGPGPLAVAGDDADTHAAQREARLPIGDAAGPPHSP
jgi:hypothetical protein